MTAFKRNRLAVSARALAGVLALGLLVFELLATNGAFHQAFHHNGQAAADNCVLCLLAKGQVEAPEAAPAVPTAVRAWYAPALRLESIALVDFRYLCSPSRAPPALAALPSAVA